MELPPDKLLAFIEELEEYGAARTPDQGIINIGPVLIRHGTKEQRTENFRAGLNGFEHGAFANLVAQASGFEIFDDRLLSGFSL